MTISKQYGFLVKSSKWDRRAALWSKLLTPWRPKVGGRHQVCHWRCLVYRSFMARSMSRARPPTRVGIKEALARRIAGASVVKLKLHHLRLRVSSLAE
jgi:hypothetical protein